ncbi:MAG: O-antigen ligase family protein [Planctomycetota bacterium]
MHTNVDSNTPSQGRSWASACIRAMRQAEWPTLFVILAVAPWVMGGRNEIGKFAYICAVAVYALLFLLQRTVDGQKRGYQIVGVEWLFVVALGIVGVSMVPLDVEWINKVSPGIYQLLALHRPGESVGLGTWETLSLAPRATQLGLCVLLTHMILFIVVYQRLDSLTAVQSALRIVALSTLVMAAVALLQYASGTPRFSFIFLHPSRDANEILGGPFANTNHFTHFLALGIGPLIWWWHHTQHSPERGPTGNSFTSATHDGQRRLTHLLINIGFGLVLTVTLIAASRGGMATMLLGIGFCGLVMTLAKIVRWPLFVGAACAAVLVALAMMIHGSDLLKREIGTLTVGSFDELVAQSGRLGIWAADLRAFQQFWLAGTGVGSHAEVYPTYFPHPSIVEYTHAECGYLQVLMETGVVGAALLLVAIAYVIAWCHRSIVSAPSMMAGMCAMAVCAGCLVTLVQSIWDFCWYVSATFAPAVVLAATAARLAHNHTGEPERTCFTLPKPGWLLATGLATLLFAGVIGIYAGPAQASITWDAYRRLSLTSKKQKSGLLEQLKIEPDPEAIHKQYADLQRMTELLNRTLQFDRHHYRAHLRLGTVLRRACEIRQKYEPNAMPIAQIRQAAEASDFASEQEYAEWLRRAIGENITLLLQARAHTIEGLKGLPLSGRSYVRLADLGFLPPRQGLTEEILNEQALRARPYDAEVLFAAGRYLAMAGQHQKALEYWKQAYHQDQDYRHAIIRALALSIPAPMFVHQFAPNTLQLKELFDYYQASGREDQSRLISSELAQRFAKEAEVLEGQQASKRWLQAARYCQAAENASQAVEMSQRAVQASPNLFDARVAYAQHLQRAGDLETAEREFIWCIRRRPDFKPARQGLAQVKQTVRNQGVTR